MLFIGSDSCCCFAYELTSVVCTCAHPYHTLKPNWTEWYSLYSLVSNYKFTSTTDHR